MEAIQTITLYRPLDMLILAEVYAGEHYFIPDNVKVYEGSVGAFLQNFPGYSFIKVV